MYAKAYDPAQWQGAKPPDYRTLQGHYVRLEALDVARHREQLWLAFQVNQGEWQIFQQAIIDYLID